MNVDPLDPKLADPIERARLARIFEQGLGQPIGYVLPLRRIPTRSGTPRWTSQPWFLASKANVSGPRRFVAWDTVCRSNRCRGPSRKMCSIPTIRIPLQSARDCLPGRSASAIFSTRRSVPDEPVPDADKAKPPEKGESAPGSRVPRSAWSRAQGKLFVFMPPVEYLADYLDLVAAIEDTAAYLKMPVLLEGYAPSCDPRIAVLKVTPDPGVIEVNIHPAASWDELAANTTALYELARQCRLGTEKFMLDGQHSGTGGGNHVVIGGPTPEDSPFLRRPDLLRSLIGYWHNHPVAVVSALGNVHRSHQPTSARGRGAHGFHLRAGNRLRPDPGQGLFREPSVAGRSHLPAPADRSGRQHASRRILHRQALLARRRRIAARPGRVARVRDASARADESHPTIAGARADGAFLGDVRTAANSCGGEPCCTTASCCLTSCNSTGKT